MKQSALVLVLIAGLGLAGCSSTAPEAAPTTTAAKPSPTATPTKTPTARPTPSAAATLKPVATSGSYAADVSKLGIKPDNMQSYASWMKEQICDQDRMGLPISVRSIASGTPSSGGGPDVVRLTNAYFCPTKTQEIEAALDE
jgi:hypothetical protein